MVVNTWVIDFEEVPRVPQSVMQVEIVNNNSMVRIEHSDYFVEFNNQHKMIGLMIEM